MTKPAARKRKPVIAVRVPLPLHKQIVKSAKLTGRSMSEEMAVMLERGLEWTRRWKGDADFGQMTIGIAKLGIESGDTVVLRTDLMLSHDQVQQLSERAREQLPEGVKLMFLTAGLSIDVMKKVDNSHANP